MEGQQTLKQNKSNVTCCVPQCKSIARKCPEVSFHRLPKQATQAKLLKRWIHNLKIARTILNSMRVCSLHFRDEDYLFHDKRFKTVPRLKIGSVPSLNLPLSSTDNPEKIVKKKMKSLEREARIKKRELKITSKDCNPGNCDTGKPAHLLQETHPDWVPTLKMGYRRPVSNFGRYFRILQREQKKANPVNKPSPMENRKQLLSDVEMKVEIEDTYVDSDMGIESSTMYSDESQHGKTPEIQVYIGGKKSQNPSIQDAEVSTLLTTKDIEEMGKTQISLNMELHQRLVEIRNLKHEVACHEYLEPSFNTPKTKFYTGLPSVPALMQLFRFSKFGIEDSVLNVNQSKLTNFQRYVLTLMRIKLNLQIEDLSYRFQLSRTSTSRVFHIWIDILFQKCDYLVKWPTRTELLETLPETFKERYGNNTVAVLVHCIEVCCMKPPSPEMQSELWSEENQWYSVKYFIGIDVHGYIGFVSKSWGGRCSDRYIIENCGFLDLLDEGDLILADYGFHSRMKFGLYCGEVTVNDDNERKLSDITNAETRRIAEFKLHIKNMADIMKKRFKILQCIVTSEFLNLSDGSRSVPKLDKILAVICALSNIKEKPSLIDAVSEAIGVPSEEECILPDILIPNRSVNNYVLPENLVTVGLKEFTAAQQQKIENKNGSNSYVAPSSQSAVRNDFILPHDVQDILPNNNDVPITENDRIIYPTKKPITTSSILLPLNRQPVRKSTVTQVATPKNKVCLKNLPSDTPDFSDLIFLRKVISNNGSPSPNDENEILILKKVKPNDQESKDSSSPQIIENPTLVPFAKMTAPSNENILMLKSVIADSQKKNFPIFKNVTPTNKNDISVLKCVTPNNQVNFPIVQTTPNDKKFIILPNNVVSAQFIYNPTESEDTEGST